MTCNDTGIEQRYIGHAGRVTLFACDCQALLGAEQDGDAFYSAPTENDDFVTLIVRYSGMVKHDYDIQGAARARLHFLAEFPQYRAVHQ